MMQSFRRLAVMVLFLPFLLVSLLGDGTMLAKTGDDRVVVVLCTGGDQVEMVWAQDGSLVPLDEAPLGDHDVPGPCDWNLVAQNAISAEPAALPPFEPVLFANRLWIDRPLHARRIDVLAPSARGPPILA
ncbi:hypothetical protein [Paracoccus methylarcula]|nr:hypothetical protein [Paracoccus methylarcula]